MCFLSIGRIRGIARVKQQTRGSDQALHRAEPIILVAAGGLTYLANTIGTLAIIPARRPEDFFVAVGPEAR
jgi:hypothetical protein